MASDERFVERFRREAKAAGALSHPNIAQIYDLGIEDNTYFLAMEYVSGENLGTLESRSPGDIADHVCPSSLPGSIGSVRSVRLETAASEMRCSTHSPRGSPGYEAAW